MGNTITKPPEVVAEDLVNKAVRQNKILIFSKSSCGYCHAAKRTVKVESNRLAHVGCSVPNATIIELDDGSISPNIAREVQTVLARLTGGHTVPRVFINHHFIGGASETVQSASSGALRLALLNAAMCKVPNDA